MGPLPDRVLRVAGLLAVALALGAAAAPAADAARNLEVGIADDAAVLENPDPARAARTVADWRAIGIDDVRLFAQWGRISPRPGDTHPPAGFDAADPNAPGYDWSALDRAVALVRGAGMTVTLSITGPGPVWATAAPAARNPRLNPVPDQFGRFARAVATRYGPQVDRYILWNEPNLPLWLQPQFSCRGRTCTPASPHMYRRLVRAAEPDIRAADPGARVLIGALAPSGQNPRSRNATMRPLTFLRALGCVDRRARRDRHGPCAGFRPASADGIAYHPHGVRRAPDAVAPQPDDAGLADLPRLESLLDAIQHAGGLRNTLGRTRRFELWLTEYGYQTNPPDRFAGVRPEQQATWLQEGAYMAWRDPRVRNLTQYVWRDEPLGPNGAGWQSGLRFSDDRPKPALRGFPHPFWADRTVARRAARLWGQVRPGGSHAVTVQRRAAGSTRWTTIRTLRTDGRGVFTLRVAVTRRVDYRFTWQPSPGGAVRASDPRRVAPVRWAAGGSASAFGVAWLVRAEAAATAGYAHPIAAARPQPPASAATTTALRPGRAPFVLVGLALFVLVAGANLATPLYAVYRDRFGFSSVVLTLVFATYQLVLCPSLIVFGQLSDRIGRRPVVAGGLAVAMVGLALFALASDTAWLFGARAVQGLAVGAASGAATAALVELAPVGAASLAALVSTLAQAGGSAFGPLVGGALAEWAPAPRTTSFVVGLLVTGVLLAGVLLVPGMPGGTGGRWRMQRPDVPRDIRAPFARFALTAAAAWAVAGLYLSVVPSYTGSLLDTTNLALEGAITATMLLASCAAQIVVRGSGRPARDQSLGLVLVIVGLVALVAAFPAHSLALILAAALLGGVGHGMAFLGAQSDLNAIAPPLRRAEITAAFFVCIYLGVAVSAIGVGLVATLSSLETAVTVFAVATAAASAAAIGWHVALARGRSVPLRG